MYYVTKQKQNSEWNIKKKKTYPECVYAREHGHNYQSLLVKYAIYFLGYSLFLKY